MKAYLLTNWLLSGIELSEALILLNQLELHDEKACLVIKYFYCTDYTVPFSVLQLMSHFV